MIGLKKQYFRSGQNAKKANQMIWENGFYGNPWTETLDSRDSHRVPWFLLATDNMPATSFKNQGAGTCSRDMISNDPYKDHKVPVFGLEAGRSDCHGDGSTAMHYYEGLGWTIEKRLVGDCFAVMSTPTMVRYGQRLSFITITHDGFVLDGDRSI
jgi:hypothetical protein